MGPDQWAARLVTFPVLYGLLYVVVEGYQSLKLGDAAIDELLSDEELVARLKRFRNATFHYQEDVVDKRLVDFLNADYDGTWLRKLHQAFRRYFEQRLSIKEFIDQLPQQPQP